MMVSLDFDIHQILDFDGVEIAADHHAQIVCDEFHYMMIRRQNGVLTENRAFMRIFDIVLDRHQSLFAHFGQHLEQHGKKIDVERLVVFRALEKTGQCANCRLDDLEVVSGDETTDRQANDRNVFERDPQSRQTSMDRIGSKCRSQNDDVADD